MNKKAITNGIVIFLAQYQHRRAKKWFLDPINTQEKTFRKLIEKGKNTLFGIEHDFHSINSYKDFKQRVPIRDYEGIKTYIDQIYEGSANVLWPGRPIYLCLSSGTTSGLKYIPITRDSMPNHINSARNAILSYVYHTNNASFIQGKMIFIQGSPELEKKGDLLIGRLSGIVAHHIPRYLLKKRLPTMKTNKMGDWEKKMDAIVNETMVEDMTLISGIPIWLQGYFEKLIKRTGKKNVKQIFENLQLLVVGGTKFEPYQKTFEKLIGKKLDRVEVYPASEGFIAYQDRPGEQGLLLLLNEGIFYEFIKSEEFFDASPTRYSISEIELDTNYALIINSNAGLWAYSIGDIVKFISKNPYRILVTGRVQHFISPFGEHVIGEQVENAMSKAIEKCGGMIKDFTVAPLVECTYQERPCHEWYIEFVKEPGNLIDFMNVIDEAIKEQNDYYATLLEGSFLQNAKLKKVRENGFVDFMKKKGKLGGQFKVPHLSNDRKIAEKLEEFILEF